jgi:ParB family chromosome partitioning protein
MSKSKLGKGLSALMEDEYSDSTSESESSEGFLNRLIELEINSIQSGQYQPRKSFDEAELGELAASIAQNGIMQPIVVRPVAAKQEGVKYEIVAGERRWRASRRIGLDHIPAIIREMSDQQALELAIVENVQREDLSALEEAVGYKQLIDEFNYTQEQLAGAVGKSRSHIANLLRLLTLPEEVKVMLEANQITMGHARALMTAEDPADLAKQVVFRNLNVRQTEKLAKGELDRPKKSASTKTSSSEKSEPRPESNLPKSEDIIALEKTLSDSLGLKVQIEDRGQQQGEIIVSYDSLEELDSILRRLTDIV